MVCMNLISHCITSLLLLYSLSSDRSKIFSKWASLSKPYMVNIDSFSAWNGQEQTQYIITTSDHVLTGSVSIHKITREGLRHYQTIMIPGAKTTKKHKHKQYSLHCCSLQQLL